MEQEDSGRNFGRLPNGIQEEIKNLLVHDKFTQAKELYEQWLKSLNSTQDELISISH